MLRQEEQPDGEPRFTMLETIRAYALDGSRRAAKPRSSRRRHAYRFPAVPEQAALGWREGRGGLATPRPRPRQLPYRPNRVRRTRSTESLVRLVHGLRVFWVHRGYLQTRVQAGPRRRYGWLADLPSLPQGASPARLRRRSHGGDRIPIAPGRLALKALTAYHRAEDREGASGLDDPKAGLAGHRPPVAGRPRRGGLAVRASRCTFPLNWAS